jgi:NadR type nicotinamide-nucleotide adenylyltransferase
MDKALILGKFAPFHSGHRSLVEYAYAIGVKPCVVVADRVPASFLRDRYSGAYLYLEEDHGIDPKLGKDGIASNPSYWEWWIAKLGPHKFERVIFSDDYGFPLAEKLGAIPHQINQDRKFNPISATRIRERPNEFFNEICFKNKYQLKVAVMGPECSGKTTLVRNLAKNIKTVAAVEEYGRLLLKEKNGKLEKEDFLQIARVQKSLIMNAIATQKPIVVVDTEEITTKLYSQAYLAAPIEVDPTGFDLYLVAQPLPFVQDGTRIQTKELQRIDFLRELLYTLPRDKTKLINTLDYSIYDLVRELKNKLNKRLGYATS